MMGMMSGGQYVHHSVGRTNGDEEREAGRTWRLLGVSDGKAQSVSCAIHDSRSNPKCI